MPILGRTESMERTNSPKLQRHLNKPDRQNKKEMKK